METEMKKFFLENKELFKKHLDKDEYRICEMRWELDKNSERIAKELDLKTQDVFILLLHSVIIIKNVIKDSNSNLTNDY